MRKPAILVLGIPGVLLFALLLLELRLRTTSGPAPELSSSAGASLRVLALGDSITRGLDREGGSWPRELQALLERSNVKGLVEVVNAAVPGLETYELSRRVDELLALHRPHVVVTMIGNADITLPEHAWLNRFRVLRLLSLWLGSLRRESARAPEAAGQQQTEMEEGQKLKDQGNLEQAEARYRRAIELGKDSPDPLKKHSWAHVLLLLLFQDSKQWHKADAVAAEIERTFPPAYTPYDFLADHARKRNRQADLDRLLEAGIRAKPDNARLHFLYSRRLEELGRLDEARRLAVRAFQLEASGPLAGVTRSSYRLISERIRAAGAQHLAVQYPRRELAPLRELLGGDRPGLLYVDNSANFAAALAGGKYSDLFIDEFGGTFGHLTPKANRIVAEAVLEKMRPWLREKGLLQ